MGDNLDFIIERKILKLGNLLISTRNEQLKKFGLTSVQSETLLFFEGNDKASIVNLRAYLNVSHQAAQKTVEQMKEKELLIVLPSEKDARARCVSITDRGSALCEILKKQGADVGQTLLSRLDDNEKGKLNYLLSKIVQ